jgi:uncharacterized damage-inducible protein DinB
MQLPLSVCVAVTAASALFAQGQLATKAPPAGNAAARQEILNIYNSAANKALALAKTIPQDKMSWRPMEGVRSFGEVFVHIAGSTLLFCSHAGMKMPEGPLHDLASVYMKRGFELPEIFASEAAIKDKAQITAVMEQASAAARDYIGKLPEADLDRQVDFFGRSLTLRNVLIAMDEHTGEHVGQAIAYARVNHIVPPWSQPQQKK